MPTVERAISTDEACDVTFPLVIYRILTLENRQGWSSVNRRRMFDIMQGCCRHNLRYAEAIPPPVEE
jgi:hypothetical protein